MVAAHEGGEGAYRRRGSRGEGQEGREKRAEGGSQHARTQWQWGRGLSGRVQAREGKAQIALFARRKGGVVGREGKPE